MAAYILEAAAMTLSMAKPEDVNILRKIGKGNFCDEVDTVDFAGSMSNC